MARTSNTTDMLSILLCMLFCYHGYSVHGARLNTIAVPPERYQTVLPINLDTLASKANLGVKSTFRSDNGQDLDTAKGVMLRRLVQTYGGYEVFGSAVVAEISMDGQYTGHLSGEVAMDLYDDIPDPEACQRNVNDILSKAIQSEGFAINDPRIKDKDGRRIAYVRQDNFKAAMAYMVDFFIDEVISRPQYIIDACDDTIYDAYNLIHNSTIFRRRRQKKTKKKLSVLKKKADNDYGSCEINVPGFGGNTKMGRTQYNVPPMCLKMTKSGSTCTMESSYGKVVNNMGSESRTNSRAISFTCSQGYTDPYGNKNGAYGTANDAMFFGHSTGEFYQKKYSFKALPWVPKIVIHYGKNYENAFWTGTDMYYGDGGNRVHPLVCLDVTAHELAHGITSTNSKLVYKEQYGGINEAFSDISGEVVEYYIRGGNDWLFAADIIKNGTAVRYFEDPTDDGESIKHVRDYKSGMDVHYSSGVFNHAFYRMVKLHNMPIYDAYRCFLDANRSRWGRYTKFTSGACHVAKACYAAGYDHSKVISAFTSVGISFSGCSLSLHGATIFSDQTRDNILVSATRKPILELNLDKGQSTIEVTADDKSAVTLVLANDEMAENVVDKKSNKIVVTSPKNGNIVYVKLESENIGDTKVVMTVR